MDSSDERRRPEVMRALEPLSMVAGAAELVVLVDVDALCSELKGRVGRELVRSLQMLAASEAQIVLVSAGAHVLAASLIADLEGAWWCDRTLGWFPGPREHDAASTMSFALVLAHLRKRIRGGRVLAISNDPCLWAALDGNDRIIVFGGTAHTAPRSVAVVVDQLIETIWCVVDIRTHYRTRFAR